MRYQEQIDQIDLYHAGQMSPEQEIAFEKELMSDPSLRAESDFQSDIINGLKEYRKLQLKARLDAIEVPTGLLAVAQQSVWVKTIGGIAVASLIGMGFFLNTERESDSNREANIPVIASEDIWVSQNQYEVFNWSLEPSMKAKVGVVSQSSISDSKNVEEKLNKTAVTEQQAVEHEEEIALDFIAPTVNDVADLSIATTALEETKSSEPAEVAAASPLDIEAINTRSNKIKYKYYDGKLFLSGNFEKKPYEIIEINGASGRRIYVLHNRKYYEVNATDRLRELPEVRNINLIQELRLIKANK